MTFLRQVTVTHIKPNGIARAISGLRTSFDLNLTPTASIDVSRLSFYNLRPATIRGFEREDVLQIEASYRGAPRFALYSGNPIGTTSEREESDVRTDFDLSPVGLRDAHVTRSWPGLQPLSQLVGDVVGAARLTLSADASIPNENLRNAAYTGNAEDVLNEMLAPFSRSVTQIGSEVRIYEDGVSVGDFVRRVDEGHGLVGAPQLTTDGGVRVRVVLDGSIEPRSRINLASATVREANGIYLIVNVSHRGDTGPSPDWYTELTCSAIDQ